MRIAMPFVTAVVAMAGLAPVSAGSIPSRNLDLLAQFNHFPPQFGAQFGSGYASCWHYVHGDGREYAILGYRRGTAIYNVTIPAATYLVDTIPGPSNSWREMKSYRNWIYVVSEANGTSGSGMQIIRMTDPEHPVLVTTYTSTFMSAHTVTVDTTRALLFANGTRLAPPSGQTAGVRILSLANPEAPAEIGRWPTTALPIPSTNYVHDSVIRGNKLYAASIYVGRERIIDVTNPAAPVQTQTFTYSGAYYTHNSWPDSSGNYLYVTDEQNGQTLRVFDLTSPAADTLRPVSQWTSNPQAIVHNAHVNGHELWLANYTEGVRVLDVTDPAHPAEFGWADTYAGASGGYKGVWGVDPYFPSGTVIASDMQSGLYVFRANRDYGLVRVEVTDAATTQPLSDASVYVTTQGDSAATRADGVVSFAPSPGAHTLVVKKFGYETVTLTPNIAQGSVQTFQVALVLKPTANLMGTVRDAVTASVLADAQVDLAYTPVHDHADAAGTYDLHNVPDDTYRVQVRRPGYIPIEFERRIGPGFDGTQDFQLQPAKTWDNLSTGAGWSVLAQSDQSHVATSGMWMRVEPYGTSVSGGGAPPGPALAIDALSLKPAAGMLHEGHEIDGATPGQIQAEYDRSPAPDSLCFVTGNVVNVSADAGDVDSTTSLTSPAFDATGLAQPTLGVWLWFYSQFRSPDDYLTVLISGDNGTTWVPVDSLRGIHNHWEEHDYVVANYVTPTSQVRMRFVAVDGGEPSVVEAGVDDVTLFEGASTPVGVLEGAAPPALGFRTVWPNPASGSVHFVLALPRAGDVEVDVLDIGGRRVRALHHGAAPAGTLTLSWSGIDDGGRRAPAGIYLVRARTVDGNASIRVARVK